MNDESKNGGKPTAADEAAVSDSVTNSSTPQTEVPSPNDSSEKTESSVVEAPPEEPEYFTVGDDMAEQIAADSTLPPSHEMSTANASASVGLPDVATPPAEEAGDNAAKASGPSDVIQEQINQNEAAPIAAVAKAPKVHNPAQTAVIVTLLLMTILSALAIFAYMSSQK